MLFKTLFIYNHDISKLKAIVILHIYNEQFDNMSNLPELKNFLINFADADYEGLKAMLGQRLKGVNENLLHDRFTEAEVSFIIEGAYPGIPSAIRRVIIDEMDRYVLHVIKAIESDDETRTNIYMPVGCISSRINMIPIRYKLADPKMVFSMVVYNNESQPLIVRTGDLKIRHEDAKHGAYKELPFDPRFELAEILPTKKVDIPEIGFLKIKGGLGHRGRINALDLEEYDRADTHTENGDQRDYSGFKVAATRAEPRVHSLHIHFTRIEKDKNVIKQIVIDACDVIIDRIKVIQSALNAANVDGGTQTEASYGDVILVVHKVTTDAIELYECTLIVKNETHTIAVLLADELYEQYEKSLWDCKSNVRAIDGGMTVVIKSKEDPVNMFKTACVRIIKVFEKIQSDIRTSGA